MGACSGEHAALQEYLKKEWLDCASLKWLQQEPKRHFCRVACETRPPHRVKLVWEGACFGPCGAVLPMKHFGTSRSRGSTRKHFRPGAFRGFGEGAEEYCEESIQGISIEVPQQAIYDDLGTPPTWRPHSWKKKKSHSRPSVKKPCMFRKFCWKRTKGLDSSWVLIRLGGRELGVPRRSDLSPYPSLMSF